MALSRDGVTANASSPSFVEWDRGAPPSRDATPCSFLFAASSLSSLRFSFPSLSSLRFTFPSPYSPLFASLFSSLRPSVSSLSSLPPLLYSLLSPFPLLSASVSYLSSLLNLSLSSLCLFILSLLPLRHPPTPHPYPHSDFLYQEEVTINKLACHRHVCQPPNYFLSQTT